MKKAQPYEVIVEEGDVLFLPPMWFHQVEALEDSISANVWSFTDAVRDIDEIYFQSVPINENWSQQKLYDAVKVYCTMLIEEYNGPSSAADFVKLLLHTRFKSLEQSHQRKFLWAKDQKYCNAELDETPLRAEMKRGIVQLRKFLDPLPKDMRMITIEDYIQDLLQAVIGVEKIPGFLEACFS